MKWLTDPKTDTKIRNCLMIEDKLGRLEWRANKIGIAGGVEELRKLMNSTEEMKLGDRGILAMEYGLCID